MKSLFENNVLTVFLEGRIDSNNAPTVEGEIMAAIDKTPNTEIMLDAEELGYISSAGLRVLMKLRNRRSGRCRF